MSNSEYNVTYIEKRREVITHGLRHRTLIPGFFSSFHMFRESKQEAKKAEKIRDYWSTLASVLTVAGTPSSCRAP